MKKWFANKRARTSTNGLQKPMPPTAPDTPGGSSTDTSAFVAAAVAAAVNQLAISSNGVSQAPQPTNSILVSSNLMIRPGSGAGALANTLGGTTGLTILAPKPPSVQPSVTSTPKTDVKTPTSHASAPDDKKPIDTPPAPSPAPLDGDKEAEETA